MRQHGGEQSGLVTLTFDLLTLKVVSKSRVTWATSVPILVVLGLSVLDLGLMYATDNNVRQKHHLMPPPIRGEGIIITIIWSGFGATLRKFYSRRVLLLQSGQSESANIEEDDRVKVMTSVDKVVGEYGSKLDDIRKQFSDIEAVGLSVCLSCQLDVDITYHILHEPRAGSGVVRIDLLRFLVGCCTR